MPSERQQLFFSWGARGALLALMLFPWLAGMCAITDDVGMLNPDPAGLVERLVADWHARFFRPLLTLSRPLLDTATRSAVAIGMVHVVVLVAAVEPLERLSLALFGGRVPRYAATTLLLLNPATVVSLWQADTVSQTASATCGVWTLAVALGLSGARHEVLAWLLVTGLGLLTKETYVGWLMLALPLALARQRGLLPGFARSASSRLIGPIVSGILLLTYVAGRFYVVGQLAQLEAAGDAADRYALSVNPITLAKNVVQLIAGQMMYGPIHAVRLYGPQNLSFWVGVLGLSAHVALLWSFLRSGSPDRVLVVALWLSSLVVLAPVLPMGHVSELYLLGPNMLVALAAARCVVALLEPGRRAVLRAVPVALLLCGFLGQASRGYHFASSWHDVRALLAQLNAIQTGRAPVVPERPCSKEGLRHSVYVVPPLRAFRPEFTRVFEGAHGRPLPEGWERQLDCAPLGDALHL